MNTFTKIAIGAGFACTSILGFTFSASAAPTMGDMTTTPEMVTFQVPAGTTGFYIQVAPGAGAEVQVPANLLALGFTCAITGGNGASLPGNTWVDGTIGCNKGVTGSQGGWGITFRAKAGAIPGNYTATYSVISQTGGIVQASDSSTYSIASTAAPVTIAGASGGLDPTFSGTGQPGLPVEVRLADGTLIATTTVGADGTWSAKSTVTLAEQAYTVTASQVDGGVTTTADLTFTVVAAPIVDPMVAGGVGVLLLAAGGGIYLARRRRSPATAIA